MSALPPWLKIAGEGLSLALAIQPNAKRTEIVGAHGDALKIKVASPPVDGAANDALLDFLAARLGIKRRDLELARGATGRQKVVRIRGVNPETAAARLSPADAPDEGD